MKFKSVFLLTAIGIAATTGYSSTVKDYRAGIKQQLKDIKSGSAEDIRKSAKALTDMGVEIAKAFIKKNKVCEDHVGDAIAAASEMMKISSEEIERDYHHGKKLAKTKNSQCYNAKDLIVHPATNVVLARENGVALTPSVRDEMRKEIIEVKRHLDEVGKRL